MKKVILDIDFDKTTFLVISDGFKLSSLRGLNIYLSSINGGYLQEGVVNIPFLKSDINEIYTSIVKLFEKRFNCEVVFSSNAKDFLNNVMEESRKFKFFSDRALKIRNNNVDEEELKSFTKILSDGGFNRKLKPFQLLAAYHLCFSQNACNFSVPGSGKTTTVLAAYELLRNTSDLLKKVDKLLVIGPIASFYAWKNEYRECYGYTPRTLEIKGGVSNEQVADKLLRCEIEEDLIIISYGSLNSKRDILCEFLSNHKTMIVLDEAHRIKNVENGIQSRVAMELAPFAKSRVVLTGTPAPNSYVDLFNLYKFIWPSHNIIGYSIAQLGNMSNSKDDSRIVDLIERTSPFYIRVRKKDLHLPNPIFHEPRRVEMSTQQMIIYNAIEESIVKSFERNLVSDFFKKASLIRLRQAASNPNLLNKPIENFLQESEEGLTTETFNDETDETLSEIFTVDANLVRLIQNYSSVETPAKFIEVKKLVDSILLKGEKVIIWCEFIGSCLDLSEYLKLKGYKNEMLYGATTNDERERIIEEFHSSSDFMIVIANPYAVGESISLHKACNNAIYFEQGFNAGVYMQSKDRIHRVGLNETDVTNYYFIHSKDTVDEVTYRRVIDKEERMIRIIDSQEIPLLSENTDFETDYQDDVKAIIRAYYERRV